MKRLLPVMLLTVIAAYPARSADSAEDVCAPLSGDHNDPSVRIAQWKCILSVALRARHKAGLALLRQDAIARGGSAPVVSRDQKLDAEKRAERALRDIAAQIPDRPSPFYSKIATPPAPGDWDEPSCTIPIKDHACEPPDLGWWSVTYHFTDPVVTMYDTSAHKSCDTDDPRCVKEAIGYYTTLGIYQSEPGGTRTASPYRSFGEWRAWAFDGAPSPDIEEAQVAYHNSPDLALGRAMHCIRHQRPDIPDVIRRQRPDIPDVVATDVEAVLLCYVANYNDGKAPAPGSDPAKGAWNAAAGDSRIATHGSGGAHDQVAVVAMQSVISLVHEGLSSDVSFFVFAPPANASDRSIERFHISPQVLLDGEAPKALPGACLPCHGGSYVKEPPQVTGAHFLPFDVGTLGLTPDPRPYQEAFRQLNALVRDASVGDPKIAPLWVELIDGWYGKDADGPCVLKKGCVSKGEYVPEKECLDGDDMWVSCGWREHRDLYVNVVAKYCRNCHISWAKTTYNPQNYKSFVASATAFVRTAPDYATISPGPVQCSKRYLLAALVHDERVMPFAEQPYRAFWANAAGPAEQLRQYFWSVVRQQANHPPHSCEVKIWPTASGEAGK